MIYFTAENAETADERIKPGPAKADIGVKLRIIQSVPAGLPEPGVGEICEVFEVDLPLDIKIGDFVLAKLRQNRKVLVFAAIRIEIELIRQERI